MSSNIVPAAPKTIAQAGRLLREGRIVAAVQEERFSRLKNDKGFPVAAFRYCLDQGGLTIADVDCVAFYEDPVEKLGRQIWMGMLPEVSRERRALICRNILWHGPESEIRLLPLGGEAME